MSKPSAVKKSSLWLLDKYFFKPFLYDIVLCIGVILIFYLRRDFFTKHFDVKNFDGIISNITSTIATFAGFTIAALTVIVTVKSSLQIRHIKQAENGIEMLLTSKNYKRILNVFKYAIVELLITLAVIYILWIPYFIFPYYGYLAVISCGILILATSIFRIAFVFFNIIFMEFYVKD